MRFRGDLMPFEEIAGIAYDFGAGWFRNCRHDDFFCECGDKLLALSEQQSQPILLYRESKPMLTLNWWGSDCQCM